MKIVHSLALLVVFGIHVPSAYVSSQSTVNAGYERAEAPAETAAELSDVVLEDVVGARLSRRAKCRWIAGMFIAGGIAAIFMTGGAAALPALAGVTGVKVGQIGMLACL